MNPAALSRPRKLRLLQMVDLVQVYCGCSKAELASRLDRDPAKIVPDSGNPKLDLVFNMAHLLDWSVGDVAEALWLEVDEELEETDSEPKGTFVELNREAIAAHRDGDHARMKSLAQQMVRIATSSRERAAAATRMMGALDLAGRYSRALDWARIAAAEPGIAFPNHLSFVANLASANYAAWNLQEALGVSDRVIASCREADLENDLVLLARAVARYVSGNALRRLMLEMPEHVERYAGDARQRLVEAIGDYEALAARRNDESFLGIANTCRGAMIEIDVETGAMAAVEGADRLAAGLETVVDPASHPRGDWLESWGWWAVFGLNLSVRHFSSEKRERFAAVFSTKAQEIADRLENWAMRERVFALEHDLRVASTDSGPVVASSTEKQWIMDREDVRNLLGTMGRFDRFRRTGWKILQQATFVKS